MIIIYCLEQWTPSNNHTLFEELDHFILKMLENTFWFLFHMI